MSDKINFEELKASGVLPSPKGVALAVIEQCQRDDIALPELAHTILGDPALAGHIIKMANAVNPNKNRPIASVTTDTLILVGIHAVRQAVLGFSLVAATQKGTCKEFDYQSFWSHSSAMACATQAVGTSVRIAPLAEIFICGLLAEVGQLGLAAARPEVYSALIKQYADKPVRDFMQAELDKFGMGRRALTSAMMADWGMPQLFIEAVSFYSDPQASGFPEGSRHLNLTIALELAAHMANLFLAPNNERANMLPRMLEIGAALNLNAERVIAIANQAALDWLEWGELLQIKTTPVPLLEVPEPPTTGDTPE